jgi:hypothetical protein
MSGPASLDPDQLQQILNAIGALKMKPPPPSLDPVQLQQLLKAVEALKPDTGWHWHNALPIFLSSLFGLLVGLVLDIIRRFLENRKVKSEHREKEIPQTRGALESIGHKLTTLIHIAAQNILPHHRETEAAYADFRTTIGDHVRTELFSLSLYRYPGLMMTAPPVYFIEYDFLEKLPF